MTMERKDDFDMQIPEIGRLVGLIIREATRELPTSNYSVCLIIRVSNYSGV